MAHALFPLTPIMTAFDDFISSLSNIVWGPPMLTLIVATGIFLTVRLRLIQFLRLGTGLRYAFGTKGWASARPGTSRRSRP